MEPFREAAIEAEYETGVREESEEQARASIHVRLARMTVGSLLLVAGVLMLALPGPGWLTIAAGLAILAKDVAWAERALDRVRRRLPEGADGEVDRRLVVARSSSRSWRWPGRPGGRSCGEHPGRWAIPTSETA